MMSSGGRESSSHYVEKNQVSLDGENHIALALQRIMRRWGGNELFHYGSVLGTSYKVPGFKIKVSY